MMVFLAIIGGIALVSLALAGVLAAFSILHSDNDGAYDDEEMEDFNI